MTVNHPNNVDEKLRYQTLLTNAFGSARDMTAPNGVGVVVFAHKSTSGWEALLEGIVRSGWIVTASWPIDTERTARPNALKTASLGSSVHIVCRPRENADGSVRTDEIGDWREVLTELPKRIHDWMPRLAEEGVVGADAIFACLGPALEIFSRYSSVEKPDGTPVPLKEYLERVWGAVSQEALNMVFAGADVGGFEEDARLTAMWLWTLGSGNDATDTAVDSESEEDDADDMKKAAKAAGFTLEYDAARKISQGLGAHLEDLTHVIEVTGDKARLLPVEERAEFLFGRVAGSPDAEGPHKGKGKSKKKDKNQISLFAELEQGEEKDVWGDRGAPESGKTVLDRVHQSMILFAAGRSEALRRFLVDEGIGRDDRFWRLAQALAALYPTGTNERRWVEGVMARKKGLGF